MGCSTLGESTQRKIGNRKPTKKGGSPEAGSHKDRRIDPKSGWPLLKSPRSQIPLDSRSHGAHARRRARERQTVFWCNYELAKSKPPFFCRFRVLLFPVLLNFCFWRMEQSGLCATKHAYTHHPAAAARGSARGVVPAVSGGGVALVVCF